MQQQRSRCDGGAGPHDDDDLAARDPDPDNDDPNHTTPRI